MHNKKATGTIAGRKESVEKHGEAGLFNRRKGRKVLLNPPIVDTQEFIRPSRHIDKIRLAFRALLIHEAVDRSVDNPVTRMTVTQSIQNCVMVVRRLEISPD